MICCSHCIDGAEIRGYNNGMTTNRTITITTDAISADILATSGDDAARQFAISERIPDVTDCATLCDHYREIGGMVRVIDANGSILCRVA